MTSSNMNLGWKETLGGRISISSTRSSAILPGSEKTSMSRQGKSMPEILLAEVGRLRLLLLLQLLLMQMPKRKQRPMQRRRPLQSPKRNLMLLLYYHHLNQNNMPKEKGKEEKESQRAEVPVLVTRRRYHVTSISLRSLAGKGKDCEYSHDQKTFDASKSGGHGKGGGKTPRGQSPANKTKKIDEPCWHWAKGKCRYGDKCNKRHDAHLFNTAPNTESPSSKAAPALLYDDSDADEPPFMIASNVVRKKVKFNPQKDEVHVYEKKDYVKSSRKSQTYSKGHNKLGKTTDEIRKG